MGWSSILPVQVKKSTLIHRKANNLSIIQAFLYSLITRSYRDSLVSYSQIAYKTNKYLEDFAKNSPSDSRKIVFAY